MLPLSALCCSRPLFQEEQSEPSAKHKGYPWSKVTCTMMASFFLFFSGCSFREKHVISKLDVFDWEGKRLGLWRKSIKRRESAVILSIKGRLTGWVMSGNHLSERDRLTQALFDLAVWTTHTENRKWSSFPGISRVLQLGAMLMAFLALTFSFSVFLFLSEDLLEGLSQHNTLMVKDQNLSILWTPLFLRWHMFISCMALMLNQIISQA